MVDTFLWDAYYKRKEKSKMGSKLIKKILGTSLIFSMTLSLMPSVTLKAISNDYMKKKIDTVEKLEKKIAEITADNKVSLSERSTLERELDQKVAEEYLMLHDSEIRDVVNTTEGKLIEQKYDQSTNTYINTYEYKVNDAITVKAKFIDEPDVNCSLAKTTITYGGGPKDLGDRKSTGEYEETILGLSVVHLKLTLGYTVNRTNIKTRYSTTSGSASYGSLSSSSYITDNIAAEKGHDMNCIGDYSIDLLGYTTTTVSLELKVKWFDSYSDGSKYITYTLSKL